MNPMDRSQFTGFQQSQLKIFEMAKDLEALVAMNAKDLRTNQQVILLCASSGDRVVPLAKFLCSDEIAQFRPMTSTGEVLDIPATLPAEPKPSQKNPLEN